MLNLDKFLAIEVLAVLAVAAIFSGILVLLRFYVSKHPVPHILLAMVLVILTAFSGGWTLIKINIAARHHLESWENNQAPVAAAFAVSYFSTFIFLYLQARSLVRRNLES
jgi:cytochrome c oxidase assembly factor CtaG